MMSSTADSLRSFFDVEFNDLIRRLPDSAKNTLVTVTGNMEGVAESVGMAIEWATLLIHIIAHPKNLTRFENAAELFEILRKFVVDANAKWRPRFISMVSSYGHHTMTLTHELNQATTTESLDQARAKLVELDKRFKQLIPQSPDLLFVDLIESIKEKLSPKPTQPTESPKPNQSTEPTTTTTKPHKPITTRDIRPVRKTTRPPTPESGQETESEVESKESESDVEGLKVISRTFLVSATYLL